MTKTLLLIAGVGAIAAAVWFFRPGTSGKTRKLTGKTEKLDKSLESENEETDGPEKREHHEYIMTVDPATGRVPTERLLEVEQVIARQQMTNRIEASNLIWQERGPNNVGGRTRAILIDKADATGNTVFAGSVGGGLWKTTNFKNASPTWTQVTGIAANLAITTIAQHPSTPAIIYAGTGEGFGNGDAIRGLGVYRSSDGGASWTLLASTTTGGANADDFSYVQKLLIYSNGNVYAATRSIYCNVGGLLRSQNNGTGWTRVLGTGTGACATSTDMRAYDIEVSASGDIYASTIDVSTGVAIGRIWKSPAGGTVGNAGTWTNVTPAGSFQRIELACSPTDNSKIYALTQGTGNGTGGTRLSADGGGSWSSVNVGNWCDQGSNNTDFTRGQAWYDLVLGIKPTDDATVYAGGVDVFKTTNSGTAWSQLTQWNTGCATLPYVHADIHAFEFFPGTGDEFVVGCDGGIFYTNNGGTSFTAKNGGYNVTQYYSVAIHPTSGSNYLLGGSQDNGSHKVTTSGIGAGTTVTGGDGGFAHIDTDNPNFQYTSFTGSSVSFSNNGGTSFSYLGNYTADRFINPTDYDPATDHIYGGGAVRNLRRIHSFTTSTMTANSFTIASVSTLSVSAVKVDPNTANRVWVAFSRADASGSAVTPELYIVDNANSPNTPTATAVTLPGTITGGHYISSLDIENGDANHILLTVSNYGVTSVWESTNGGGSWTSIEGNLPDMPVRWGKFMPAGLSPNTRLNAVGGILLATEMGVWSTNLSNGASTVWVANNAGMGNVRVNMIKIRASDNRIAIATHGRGFFVAIHSGTLPVQLTEFKGTLQGKTALLQWKTSGEINSSHFELEKSNDGTAYRKIATVKAAGSSTSDISYSHIDNEALSENNYYRLKSVDLDNEFEYSNVVLVRLPDAAQGIYVLGNPFRDNISLRFIKTPKTRIDLQLFDISGKLVIKQEFGAGTQQIQLPVSSKLPAGVYQLRVVVDGTVYTEKLLKQ